MEWSIRAAARLIRWTQKAWIRKWSFLGFFIFSFCTTFALLARFDLLPESIPIEPDTAIPSDSSKNDNTIASPEFPVKIIVEKIGLSASVANPATTDIGILDAALLSGAVRYPTSARLQEDGNVVIFGHSSYLPVVHNQAYKSFNSIQNLTKGDLITVYSSGQVYTYMVKTVTKENAENGVIPLIVPGRQLTLSTCDSFGKKSSRFVVVADFVESHAVPT